MKKFLKTALLALVVPLVMLSGCARDTTPEWQFSVGDDEVIAEGSGVTTYSPTFTVNLKVVGGSSTELYNGTVELKSNTMYASEFLKAAVTDKALAQAGIDVGFVTTIGDYVNNSEDSIYWLYTVNGVSPDFGCNQMQMRDGDYMLWTYEEVDWTAEPEEVEKLSGDWEFAVGDDEVTATSASATQYSPTYTVNLKIVGGAKTVLFNGTVTLTSGTMLGSEFLKEAVTDKALAQAGIDVGFVTTIGSYVNNAEDSIYWMYTINGATPAWGVNGYQMRDGDYMLWTYDVVEW